MSDSPTEPFRPPENLMQALGAIGDPEIDGEAGTGSMTYRVRPEFCHTGGIAQGGFVSGWLDQGMAMAAFGRVSQPVWLATLELKVSFLGAAREGMEVRSVGRIVRQGKSILFLDAELFDQDGNLLATASSTAKLVPLRT